jgi:hypothetical protein
LRLLGAKRGEPSRKKTQVVSLALSKALRERDRAEGKRGKGGEGGRYEHVRDLSQNIDLLDQVVLPNSPASSSEVKRRLGISSSSLGRTGPVEADARRARVASVRVGDRVDMLAGGCGGSGGAA